MNKVILIGRSESGKTTLTQALRGEELHYDKTQSVEREGFIIDTPGEYIQTRNFGGALAVYAYESDIVGLLLSATEPYSLFSPNITSMANRLVIGIITGIDQKDANPDRAERWLRLAGCKQIFRCSSVTGEGIAELKEFLTTFDTKKFYKENRKRMFNL
ncbi:MAG: ethanolamine utilization protein EutP [Clostridia bacterium]|nr:ethanolamine utilization protein EutP [Clostridia bacterium]